MRKKLWERQANESVKAYEGFSIYRDLGVNRTLEIAWRRYSESEKTVPGYFRQWSSTYDWVARVTAYDDWVDAEARKKLDREAIKRKAEVLKRHANTGRVLQGKGLEYLQAHGLDKSSDALVAVNKGIEIERKAESFPDWIFEVVEASDSDLVRQYNELLTNLEAETPEETDPEV